MSSTSASRPTLFERIIAREIPAKIAYEDERYIVIHDIEPKAPVHLLVIPKVPTGGRVIPMVSESTPDEAALIGGMFKVGAEAVKALGYSDFRAVFNNGAGAQQTVFHIHLHILAGRSFSWPPG